MPCRTHLKYRNASVFGLSALARNVLAVTFLSSWKLFLTKVGDRKSTRLNSSHSQISYAVFCLKKKNNTSDRTSIQPSGQTCWTCLHLEPHAPFIPCALIGAESGCCRCSAVSLALHLPRALEPS